MGCSQPPDIKGYDGHRVTPMIGDSSLRTREPIASVIIIHPSVNEESIPKGTPPESRYEVGDNAM